jgi:CelD/BcsL family acetyltransferase involved in cellulose biosynthesis
VPTLSPGYRVRILTAADVSPAFVSAWSNLESSCLEPNAYLSPHFVLPAIRHLDGKTRVLIVVVETGPTDLAGVGVFRSVPATRSFPLPHLVAYQSRHAFLSGLLIDRERALAALNALFDFLHTMRWRWHGLEFRQTWGDGVLSDLIATTAAQRGMRHVTWDTRLRATLVPAKDVDALGAILGSRDTKRRMRRLQERGEVTWTLHRQGGIPEKSVETFLDLEHRGWKGESKTSLRSNPADEAFFREVVSGFGASDRAFFTELALDRRVIASTSNFISGHAGFAFKVGWLPEFAKMSPGVLNEIETIRHIRDECNDLLFLDSGASEGSYMDELWPSRRPVVSMAIASTLWGRSAFALIRTARTTKRRLLGSRLATAALKRGA